MVRDFERGAPDLHSHGKVLLHCYCPRVNLVFVHQSCQTPKNSGTVSGQSLGTESEGIQTVKNLSMSRGVQLK